MDRVLLIVRLLLAGVFLVPGLSKLADRQGSPPTLGYFGVPAQLATPLKIVLLLAAVAVAATLLLKPSPSAATGPA